MTVSAGRGPIAAGTGAEWGSAGPPPLSLYIHVPWCIRKCPYCDFNSHAVPAGEAIPEQAYLDALIGDLESTLPAVWGRTVRSVFFGGGTPGLLSGPGVARLLAEIRARITLEPGCEITLETNPGALEEGRYAAFRDAGVNRLSIGVQSFDDASLRRLGRVHDGGQAERAIESALRSFDNVNLDLMIGLPDQTEAAARQDVVRALGFGTTHLSVYQLTIEANTVFAKFPPRLPEEDVVARAQEEIDGLLAQAGFEHYEVSAYARPGRRCRHNLNYWTFGDYLGIGAGAHAKISLPGGGVRREERFRAPDSYLRNAAQGHFVSQRRAVAADDLVFEFALNAFRLREGFAPALFAERTGLDPTKFEPGVREGVRRGLIARHPGRIAPTGLGMRFLNDLQALFLPAGEGGAPESAADS